MDLLKRFFGWIIKEDHNEREFKPYITGEILDLPKKSSNTREASIISGPQLNIIASILEHLKILSEVRVASKCGPLARIEKLDLLKSLSKIKETRFKRFIIKDRKSNYGIPLDLQKRSSKIREDFVNNPQLDMIQ